MIIQDTFRLDLTGMTQAEAYNAIEEELGNMWAREKVLRQKLIWAQKQGIHELPKQKPPFPEESACEDRSCPMCHGRKWVADWTPHGTQLNPCPDCQGPSPIFA